MGREGWGGRGRERGSEGGRERASCMVPGFSIFGFVVHVKRGFIGEYIYTYICIYIWKERKERRKKPTCSIRLRPPTLFPRSILGGLRKRHQPPPRSVIEGLNY